MLRLDCLRVQIVLVLVILGFSFFLVKNILENTGVHVRSFVKAGVIVIKDFFEHVFVQLLFEYSFEFFDLSLMSLTLSLHLLGESCTQAGTITLNMLLDLFCSPDKQLKGIQLIALGLILEYLLFDV